MKILFGFIILIIVGSLAYFFTQTQTKPINDEPTTIEKLNTNPLENEKNDINNSSSESQQNSDLIEEKKDSTNNTDTDSGSSEKVNSDSIEEMDDTPEYGEEVSSEDFKEFIGIALEELDSGDEMAEAIITEMIKIAEAQPDHVDQVKSFYRACAEKPNLSNENQQLCLKLLEKISEPSN